MDDINVEPLLEMVYIAKLFYDHGKEFELAQTELYDDDNLEFCYEAALSIFEDVDVFYDDESEENIYILRDTMMARYFHLCRRYEREKGISKRKDPFRARAKTAMRDALNFNSYCYDYRYRANPTRKNGCAVIFYTNCEFYFAGEVIEGFWDLLDFYTEGVTELEALLKPRPELRLEAA